MGAIRPTPLAKRSSMKIFVISPAFARDGPEPIGNRSNIHFLFHKRHDARVGRIVVSGRPHQITARGDRREPIFLGDRDQDINCDSVAGWIRKASVVV
jgi:hypothetical protein